MDVEEAAVPKAGEFALYIDYGSATVRQIEKVTPKLIKFGGRSWPRQIKRGALLYAGSDEAALKQLGQSIDGVRGEYNRRRAEANKEFNARVAVAREAMERSLARLISQARAQASA